MKNIKYFIFKNIKVSVCLLNLCFTFVCIFTLYNAIYGAEHLTLTIEYDESYSNNVYAQFFYAETEKDMNEDDSVKSYFNDNIIKFRLNLSIPEYQRNLLRIDPSNFKGNVSIKEIKINNGRKDIVSLNGKSFEKYIKSIGDANLQLDGNNLNVEALTNDCRFVLNSKFNRRILDGCINNNLIIFYIELVLYFIWGVVQVVLFKRKSNLKKIKWYDFLKIVLTILLLSLGSSLIYGEQYLIKNFDDVPLGQLIYHLHTPLDGTNTESFTPVIVSIIMIILINILIVTFIYWILRTAKKTTTFLNWASLVGVIEILYAVLLICVHFDAISYFKYTNQETTIYEENYVDGRDVKLEFPEQKRNLVYIFLESMEMTYTDESVGGAMQNNYIPELTNLSLKNENFGIDGQMNGAYTVPGATFTMGGLVAQTSGVPINETLVSNDTLNSEWESDNNYVPGVWSIGDILENQGYNQEFMIGSDGKFAGRSSYFKGHGDYDVFDYYTAIDRNYINGDYKEWWGYEDKKLFEYAKREITKLSKKDEPFNFTMLTADTHFTDGYLCDLCENEYNDQYSNVMSCSSKQVAAFVAWVQEQDFYDNTTIVISGDHLTMDSGYIDRNGASNFDRRTYFTVINGDAVNEKTNVAREYTTLDLFPTTVAALGVQIEGNKLGLGINLYSSEPTLIERYGDEYMDVELLKDSKLYRKKILYGD